MYILTAGKRYECSNSYLTKPESSVIFYVTEEPDEIGAEIALYAEEVDKAEDFCLRTVNASDYQYHYVDGFGEQYAIIFTNTPKMESNEEVNLDEVKAQKIREMSEEIQSLIEEGVEIGTSKGMEHFSMTTHDQMNIAALYNYANMAENEDIQIFYHADGKMSRPFSRDEIHDLYHGMVMFTQQHLNAFNIAKHYVLSLNSASDVQNVTLNSPIPESFQKEYENNF